MTAPAPENAAAGTSAASTEPTGTRSSSSTATTTTDAKAPARHMPAPQSTPTKLGTEGTPSPAIASFTRGIIAASRNPPPPGAPQLSPLTSFTSAAKRRAMDIVSTNDLYARAQAMGLKLSREDLERTRAGVAAIVQRPRPSPSSSVAPVHAPTSSSPCPPNSGRSGHTHARKVTTPHSSSSRRPPMVPSSGGSNLTGGPRLTLEQVSLRKEQDGEDRRRNRQRRKSDGTPSQALSRPEAASGLGSSSSRLLDFSSPYSLSHRQHQSHSQPQHLPMAMLDQPLPQHRWLDRSGRLRARNRMTLDEVGIRAEEGSEEKRKARRRRRTAEDSAAELTDNDSIRPDDEDMLPLLIALPTPDVTLAKAGHPQNGDEDEDEDGDGEDHAGSPEALEPSPEPLVVSPQLVTPFRGQDGMDDEEDLPLLEGPQTPAGSPNWWPQLSSPTPAEPGSHGAERRQRMLSGPQAPEHEPPPVAKEEEVEAQIDVLPVVAEEAPQETGDEQDPAADADTSMLTEASISSTKRVKEEEPEPASRPKKKRKKARISDGPSSEAVLAATGDDADMSTSEDFLEAWDYTDGTRVIKLISDELANAIRMGSLAEDAVEPRYYTLPTYWGQDKEKPSHASYAGLIGLAILSSSDGKLGLAEIYQWINTTFPFYDMRDRGWQNSIRHNLSLNKSFIKVERKAVELGKGALWSIQPGHECRFENGTYNAKKAVVPSQPANKGGGPHAGYDATDNEADDEGDLAELSFSLSQQSRSAGYASHSTTASTSANPDELGLGKKQSNNNSNSGGGGGSQVLAHTLHFGTSHKFYRQKRDPAADVAQGLCVPIVVPILRPTSSAERAAAAAAAAAAGGGGSGGGTTTSSKKGAAAPSATATVTPKLGGKGSLAELVPDSQESVRTSASVVRAGGHVLHPFSSTPARGAASSARRGGRGSGAGSGSGRAGGSLSSSSSSLSNAARLVDAVSRAETAAARAAVKVGGVAAADPSAAHGAEVEPVKSSSATAAVASTGAASRGRRRAPLKDKTNLGARGKAAADAAAATTAAASKGKGKAKAADNGPGLHAAGREEEYSPDRSAAGAVAMDRGESTSEGATATASETSSNVDIHSPAAMRGRGGGRGPARRAVAAAAAGHPMAAPSSGSSSSSSTLALNPSPSHILGQPILPGGPFSSVGAVVPGSNGPTMAAAAASRWPMRSPISSLRSSMGAPLLRHHLGTGPTTMTMGGGGGGGALGSILMDEYSFFGSMRSPEDGRGSARRLGGAALGQQQHLHPVGSNGGAGPSSAAAAAAAAARNNLAGLMSIDPHQDRRGGAYHGIGVAAGMEGVSFLSSRNQLSPLRGSPLRPTAANNGGGGGGGGGGTSSSTAANTAGALRQGGASVMLPIAGLTPARRILAGHTPSSSFSPLLHTPGGLGSLDMGLGSMGMGLGMGISMGMGGLRSMGIGSNTGLGNAMSPVNPLSSVLQTPARGSSSSLGGSAVGSAGRSGAGERGGLGGSGLGASAGRSARRRRRESSDVDGGGSAVDRHEGGAAGSGNGPLGGSSGWFFSSTPIRRLMSGAAGSDHTGSPQSTSTHERTGSPYARGGRSHAGSKAGSGSGGGSVRGEGGSGGGGGGGDGTRSGADSQPPSSSLGTASTPTAAAGRSVAAAAAGAGSTGLTPGGPGDAHWLGDPFGFQGNFSHELAFTTEMGGFGTGIDSSPAKEMWR